METNNEGQNNQKPKSDGYDVRRFPRRDRSLRGPRSAVSKRAQYGTTNEGTRPASLNAPHGQRPSLPPSQDNRSFPRRDNRAPMGAHGTSLGQSRDMRRSPQGGMSSRSRPGTRIPYGDHAPRSTSRVKHTTGREKADARRMSIPLPAQNTESIIPPLKDGDIRIVPLGGVEEIGRNMTCIEFKDTILIIDAGLQFREDNTPGVDYILPNTKYLEERKHKIKAIFITHGHLDHIGCIPYVMEKIGNPPIYSRNLSTLLIKKRQDEFPHLPALDIRVVEKKERATIGDFKVEFFGVTHTIPDAMGVIIETPYGNIVHTGDLKLDHDNGVPTFEEAEHWEKIENTQNLLLMADSTNVERPGFSFPERIVLQNIENIIRNTEGRLVIATFASLLERLIKIIDTAEVLGKKIVLDGRSMKNNVDIAREAGFLTAKKETFIPVEEMDNYPPDRIIMLVTGAQGDEFASLMRAANKTHKYLKVNKRDTILLSSSVIPGNERSVQKLKDNLSRQGATIIHYQNADVHSSGHACHDETLWIHQKVKPRFFIPIHGYHYLLRVHADIAKEAGMTDDHIIIPDNSMVIEIQNEGKSIVALKETAPRGLVLVDGFSVGSIQEVVLRDRQMLSQDGIFVIIATLDRTTGKITKSPDIISRGFVYLRESQDLLRQARLIAKNSIEELSTGSKQIDFDYIKDHTTDAVARFLFQETAKRPIVIPVILGL